MIRIFQNTDLDEVACIWLNANLDAHAFIPASYWTGWFPTVREQLSQAEVYVCEENNTLLGFIGLDGENIAGIFVQEGARSRGVGHQLLSHVKSIRSRLYLHVYEKNTRALAFYQREGFRLLQACTDEDTREAELVMVWER